MGCRTLPTDVRTLAAARGHPADLPARRGYDHFGVNADGCPIQVQVNDIGAAHRAVSVIVCRAVSARLLTGC